MNRENFTRDELVAISVVFEKRATTGLAKAVEAEIDGDEWRVNHYTEITEQALEIANRANRNLGLSEIAITKVIR